MRTAFFDTLTELAAHDDRIYLLTGDLGFGSVERFNERNPGRFINVGVAEQNMIGLATGLALSGKVVFVYSIGNFPTLRCLEQIRNGPCYHRANVKIVAVGGGLAYGSLGMTHHATEDIAVIRALPEMMVIAPGDPTETRLATAALATRSGPAYLRLGRAGEPAVHAPGVNFEPGRAIRIRDGDDVTLIATGTLLHMATTVADALLREGIHCRVLSMHTVKPIDEDALRAAARETRVIVTLEEHSLIGGLGSAVVETLADAGELNVPVKRVGLPSAFVTVAGSRDYLCEQAGLSHAAVLRAVKTSLAQADRRRPTVTIDHP